MFEKEAEEYIKANNLEWELECHRTSPIGEVKQAFQKGAEFGYNKGFEFGVKSNEKVNKIVAKEWHYVKDGLSEKEKYVLIYTDLKNVYIARLGEDYYFITNKGGFVQTSSVIAWKEIVLPELKESE